MLIKNRLFFILAICFSIFIFSCSSKQPKQQTEATPVYVEPKKELTDFNKIQYSSDLAYSMMFLANLTYDKNLSNPNNVKLIQHTFKNQLPNDIGLKDYQAIWLGTSKNHDNLSFVLRKQTQDKTSIIIANRGTIFNFLNLRQDLEVYKQINWRKNDTIKVSEGMYKALNAVLHQTGYTQSTKQQKVDLETLIEALIDKDKISEIYITGHSLGGAISTVLAMHFVEKYEQLIQQGKVKIGAFTFANQTVGNSGFVQKYHSYIERNNFPFSHYRVINPRDVVPYAFGHLSDINILYPMNTSFSWKLKIVNTPLIVFFSLVDYQHAGQTIKLKLNSKDIGNCKAEVASADDYGCWILHNHSSQFYMELLLNKYNKI